MIRRPDTDALEKRLLAVGKRLQRQPLLKGYIRLFYTVIAFLLAFFVIDWLTHIPYPVRLGVWICGLAWAIIWFLRGPFKASRRAYSAQEVSLLVEKQYPELHSKMISTLQFQAAAGQDFSRSMSVDLIEGMIDRTFGQLPQIKVGKIISNAWFKKGFLYVILAIGCAVATVALGSEHVKAFVKRLVMPGVKYPTKTQIMAVNLPELIAAETQFKLEVKAGGEIPRIGHLEITTDQGFDTVIDLKPDEKQSDTFVAMMPPLMEAANVTVFLGDAEKGPIVVTPVPRPHIKRFEIRVKPPVYTGLKSQTIEGGNANVIAGSQVAFVLTPTKKLNEAKLTSMRYPELLPKLTQQADGSWTGTMTATKSMPYSLNMVGDLGLHSNDLPQFRLGVTPDKPPVVRIRQPAASSELAPQSGLPMQFTVSDDFEISKVEIRYRVITGNQDGEFAEDDNAPSKLYAQFPGQQRKKFEFEGLWENKKINPEVGQQIRMWVEATDNAATPQVGRSQEVIMAVITAKEYRSLLEQSMQEVSDPISGVIIEIKGSKRTLEKTKEKKTDK